MLRNCFLLFSLLMICSSGYGQNNSKMTVWQDSLLNLGSRMFGEIAETERIESNFTFVKTLVSALKEPNSFYFAFEKLKMVSILSAPDKSFRIISWNLPLQDGSYLYYGTIQHKSGTIKLTPLLDKTFQIDSPDLTVVSNKDWYGAQYFDIVPLAKNQYIVLGWKGHHPDYTKKVIDILNFAPNGDVSFGAHVFSDDPKLARKIFSFTRQAAMYLKYNGAEARIEFDHIVAADPSMEGNFKYYGPDLSHDAYVIERGKLVFKENIQLQNPVSGDEGKYIDPLKPSKKLKSGL